MNAIGVSHVVSNQSQNPTLAHKTSADLAAPSSRPDVPPWPGPWRNDLAHADTVAKRCGVQGVISSGVLPAVSRSAMAFPMPGLS